MEQKIIIGAPTNDRVAEFLGLDRKIEHYRRVGGALAGKCSALDALTAAAIKELNEVLEEIRRFERDLQRDPMFD